MRCSLRSDWFADRLLVLVVLAPCVQLPAAAADEKHEIEGGNSYEKAPPAAPHIAPRIEKYPDALVWSKALDAMEEFPGFAYIGEFAKGSRALQVTPSQGRFYLSMYEGGLPGGGWDGGEITHKWVDADAIKQMLRGWQRVVRSDSVTGRKAPEDALVLFDGTGTQHWRNGEIDPGGFLKAGTRTKRKFRDFRLYLEFLIPLKPFPPISHPHRGNSGVFALGAYEVQIADTFALDPSPKAWIDIPQLKPVETWCGGIYGVRAARVNMCLPPLSWQSMEIEFRAARFAEGEKVTPATMSVVHNGVTIHKNETLPQGTGGGPQGPRQEVPEGSIVLQDHGSPNLFRNIWIVPR